MTKAKEELLNRFKEEEESTFNRFIHEVCDFVRVRAVQRCGEHKFSGKCWKNKPKYKPGIRSEAKCFYNPFA